MIAFSLELCHLLSLPGYDGVSLALSRKPGGALGESEAGWLAADGGVRDLVSGPGWSILEHEGQVNDGKGRGALTSLTLRMSYLAFVVAVTIGISSLSIVESEDEGA